MADHSPDDELLRRMLSELDPSFDPPPEDLLRISEGLLAWRTVEADLAELETTAATAGAGVRAGAGSPTRLTFVHETEEVVVEFDPVLRSLVVDLGGTWAMTVALRMVGHSDRVVIPDEAGVCRLADVDAGPAQILIRRSTGGSVKTLPFVL